MELSDAILRGELQPDAAAITEALAKQPPGADALLVNGAYAVLLVVWVFGIVDSWRVGRDSDEGRGVAPRN
jgi:hypothetical protein